MRWRNIELFVVCTFLMLTLAEFIQAAIQIRIFGPNLLHYRIWQYIVIVVIFLSDRHAFKTRSMTAVYVYTVIYLVMGLLGHYVSQRYEIVGTGVINILPVDLAVTLLIKEHYLRPEKIRDLRIVLKVAWFAFILACITSLIVITRYPSAVRGTEYEYFRGDVSTFKRLGLGGYGLFSSLPFLIPIVFYYYKDTLRQNRFKSFFYLLVIALFIYTSYKAVIVAPFIITLTVVLLSALGRKRFKTNLIIILLLLAFFVVTPRHIIGQVFIGVSETIPNRDMSTKFRDIGISYITGIDISEAAEGSVSTVEHRAARIAINWDQFLANPLIGKGTSGNPHLYWLNILAQFGLLGAFPIIWVTLIQFVYWEKLEEEYRFYYFVSILAYVVMLFIKAHGGYHYYLAVFFMVPGSYYLRHGFNLEHGVQEPSMEMVSSEAA